MAREGTLSTIIWRNSLSCAMAASLLRFVISAPSGSFHDAGRREPECLMSRCEARTGIVDWCLLRREPAQLASCRAASPRRALNEMLWIAFGGSREKQTATDAQTMSV